jgi:hypothetical protein
VLVVAPSYETINYSLRAAKQIERKMICEASKKLAEFCLLEAYRYVGFGSVFFSDFIMIHRMLSISKMVSIEKDEHKKPRFEFNKPYACIKLEFGNSTTVLPVIGWNDRTILWLDYDGPLDGDVLSDVSSFCANAISGSLLLVSVNAHPPSSDIKPVDWLTEKVGSKYVPLEIEKTNFSGWNFAKLVRRILCSTIKSALNDRNGALGEYEKLEWHQVISFDYQDGAKMTTIGGVVVSKSERPHFDKCAFSALEFHISDPQESYRIEVPILTRRELRHLDQQLPLIEGSHLKGNGIPAGQLRQYEKVYRYYPNFAETDQ